MACPASFNGTSRSRTSSSAPATIQYTSAMPRGRTSISTMLAATIRMRTRCAARGEIIDQLLVSFSEFNAALVFDGATDDRVPDGEVRSRIQSMRFDVLEEAATIDALPSVLKDFGQCDTTAGLNMRTPAR